MNIATNERNPEVGLSWNDFNREDLQPESKRRATAVIAIAVGLFVSNAAFAICAHRLKYDDATTIASSSLILLGVGVLISFGEIGRINSDNQRVAELVRRLDAGEFISRSPPQNGLDNWSDDDHFCSWANQVSREGRRSR